MLNEKTSSRASWIDVLRALAMLMVIFGHIFTGGKGYFVITSPIKIPLFFAITGYVFKMRDGNIKKFFRNLFLNIVIPLLCFTVILLPVKLLASRLGFIDKSYDEILKSFLLGNEFWYLTCCVVAEIIYFFVRKTFKKTLYVCIVEFVATAFGYVLMVNDILSVANINTAFFAQAFLMIGFLFKTYEDKILSLKITPYLCAMIYIAGIMTSFIFFPEKSIDVHRNIYYCLPLNIVMIFTGVFFLFFAASRFNVSCRLLEFIGRNTLVYYVIHEYVAEGLYAVAKVAGISIPVNIWTALLLLVLTCALCGVAAMFINRFLPFFAGKKKKA